MRSKYLTLFKKCSRYGTLAKLKTAHNLPKIVLCCQPRDRELALKEILLWTDPIGAS